MKKTIQTRYILPIAALLTVLACSTDEAPDASVDNPIRYHVGMQSGTRSVVSGTTLPEDGTFLLYAVKSREGDGESVIIDGDEVSCTDHVWQTSTVYYWPFNSFTVDFYAVCPFDAPFSKSSRTLTYTQATPITGHNDVLCAHTTSSRGEAETVGYAAELDFNHVLTQVKISGYKKNADWTVVVKGITLHNINSAGTYNMTSGEWSGQSTPASYTLGVPGEVALTTTDKDSPTPLTSEDGSLLLIPQSLSGWITEETIASTTKSYLRIECRIINAEGTAFVGSNTSFGYAYVPLPADWTAGNVCQYVLAFGSGYDSEGLPSMMTIDVSASIEPWTTVQTLPDDFTQKKAI